MRARKNVANLTDTERVTLANALIELHQRPSQRGLANRYDDFACVHVDAMNVAPSWGHGGPAFTAWHRVLLKKFEDELRSVDDTIRIPYWDWTVDRTTTSPPWFADLLGGDGGASNPAASQAGEVTTGPLRHSAGNWTISTTADVNDDGLDRAYLARGMGRRADAPQLPTADVQQDALDRDLYSLFVWDLEVPLHNNVHRWVNGQMYLRASPHDPVFWLHHCNIDRLWALWMRGRPDAERYTAAATDPSYHQPNGDMIFHDSNVGPAAAPFAGTYKPVDTIGDHAFGVWYEGDPPIVTLQTPSVSFVDVEEGRTTYAAIVFEVEAVEPVSFELLSSVSAPFGLPASLHPPAPVVPGDTAQPGRVWLSFTAVAGPVTPITVTVRCVQTGEVWNISVSANVVPPRTAAVALVADRSGSMAQDAGNGLTKRDKLGQALGIVAGLARDVDELALVSFDDQFDVVVASGDALAAGAGGTRDQLAAAATSPALDPRGLTGIGGGIQLGLGELAGATADSVALVVITDGVENVPPLIADVAGSITSTTYAIGIGPPSVINEEHLREICQGHDGYLLVTGDLAGEELFRLHKYFLQIHAGVTNQDIVVDPDGALGIGDEHQVPFVLTRADIAADVIVLCPLPGVLDVRLKAPDGTLVEAGAAIPAATELSGDWLAGWRLSLPVAPGAEHAGDWTALISIDRKKVAEIKDAPANDETLLRRGVVPYSLVVSARSDLRMRVVARRDGREADMLAVLDAYGVPFEGSARVIAYVSDPHGRTRKIALESLGDGRFGVKLKVPDPGLYTMRVVAVGELDGYRFTREQVVSVATVSGKPNGDKRADSAPRGPRTPKRPKLKLGAALRPVAPPQPLPEPEPIAPDALKRHRHSMHAGPGGHFPSEHEVAPPEPWEPGALKAAKAAKRKSKPKPTPPGDGHGH